VAPDFELPVATREGVQGRVRLSDFRDQTVVIAFFYQARTRG
jgi:peroxiredoxin